jgi:hypothetical protein
MAPAILSFGLLCALPAWVAAQQQVGPQNLNTSINERPSFVADDLAGEHAPTAVYVTLSVVYIGDISEQQSTFSVDAFVDVAWRDDRFGYSAQAYGCTQPEVAVGLLTESYAPTVCPDLCVSASYCSGGAAPIPWSPFLEVTNVAPASGAALSFPTGYVVDGAPGRLNLADTSGTWMTASARFSGPILKVYKLEDFPYDTQLLEVYFESFAWPIEDVILVPTYNPDEIKETIQSSGSMMGWDVQSVDVSTRPHFYPQLDVNYHQAVLGITVRRQASPFAIRYVMVEIFVIAMMCLASIRADAAVRIGSAATGFASTLYLQFILASLTPPLNYLTRLDTFLILSLIISFICSALGGVYAWRTWSAAEKKQKAKAEDSELATVEIREPAGGTRAVLSSSPEKEARSFPKVIKLLLAHQDVTQYGLVFVVYSIASACILLA